MPGAHASTSRSSFSPQHGRGRSGAELVPASMHFYNTRDVLAACPGHYTEAEALAANCWPVPEVAQNMNTKELGNPGLTAAEEEAIVAFLKTLSDGYLP